ncbi:MAG: hypothetical protein ACRYFS_16170 [Janthinobacterium lividum]
MTRLETTLNSPTRPIRDTDRFFLTASGLAALEAAVALETVQEVALSARQAYDGPATGMPKPEWVRGVCPDCSAPVVANSYYCGGRGFIVIHECWNSLPAEPTCTHRKVF